MNIDLYKYDKIVEYLTLLHESKIHKNFFNIF